MDLQRIKYGSLYGFENIFVFTRFITDSFEQTC